MKKVYNKIIATVGIMAVCTTVAEATPAFARQMNSDCKTCHYQNIPKLNSFGKEFKLSGFTMTGGVKEVVSKDNGGLAIPSNLNMAFVIKARYHDVTNNKGVSGDSVKALEVLDESAFIFGGKITENIGTSMEFDGSAYASKFIFSKPFEFGRLGLAYFTSEGFGAFSGLEVQTTGLYRPVRQFENRKKANIFQKNAIGNGQATGVQAFYSGNGIVVTAGQYLPVYGPSADAEASGYKTFARATYELNTAGYNITLGGYYIGGDTRTVNTAAADLEPFGGKVDNNYDRSSLNRESTGLDFQLQGDVSNMSLMVTAGYILSNTYDSTGTVGAADNHNDTGFSIAAQVNPIETVGVKFALLSSDDEEDATGDSAETSISLGTDYNVAQNVRLCLEYSTTSFGDSALESQQDILFMTLISF